MSKAVLASMFVCLILQNIYGMKNLFPLEKTVTYI